MSVTEVLQALGSWELRLKESTPDHVTTQLGYFGHVVIVDGPVDVAATGNGLLAGARYVGVCREQDHPSEYVRGGSGALFWVGDEDGKGHVIENEVSLTNATLAQVVAALKPPTVTTGTIYPQADPAARYTGKHVFQSPREALSIALAPFGAELRVNPDFSIDVGTPSQLYRVAAPDTIIKRRGIGSDIDLTAIGGAFDVGGSAVDVSTRIKLLGQTIGTGDEPDTVFAIGALDAPSVPWKDPQGNTAKFTRIISSSGETTGSIPAQLQLQLNRFNRTTTSVKVTAEQYEVQGSFAVGDATYVFDPDSGIVNPGLEVFFRGEVLHPDIVRVSERTWPIVEGMTVAWRTDLGVWLDLTPWVMWETAGSHELTVGDLPKTLLRSGQPNGAVQDRVDAARGNPSTKTPKAPNGLTLSTSSAVNPKGTDSAIITATWDPVTQYTDNTTVALSHYEVQDRPTFRAPQWQAGKITAATTVDLPVVAALAYDVQVRAVSTGGVPSAWTTTAPITSAADSTGPATPSDPVVSQYLGLLRIYWNGLTSTGTGMPADFNRVDVHVGTTSGFTASAATLVSSLSVAGYAHATAPYGSARFVRFIAYDHNGNPSAASATVTGTTAQAGDGDIAALSVGKLTAGTMAADVVMAGRFTTALTGQRREMNAIGWQAFDAVNALTVNIDGVNNLLTGIFKTALTGRRIEAGASGNVGEISFFAPDGTKSYVKGFTNTFDGSEAILMGVPIGGAQLSWNSFYTTAAEQPVIAGKLINMIVGGATTGTRGLLVTYVNNKATMSDPGNYGLLSITPDTTAHTITTAGDYLVYEHPTSGADTLRMWIDGGSDTAIYTPSTANFGVYDRLPDGSIRSRIFIDGDSRTVLTRISGQVFAIADQDPTNLALFAYRFSVDDTKFHFNWYNINARMEVQRPDFGDRTATIMLTTIDNFGVKIYHKSTNIGTSHRLEFRDAGDSIYEDLWASAFTVASSRNYKADIVQPEGGALDIARRNSKLKTYRRKAAAKVDGEPSAEWSDRLEVGFIAEEMAPELVIDYGDNGPMVDVYGTAATALAGVAELDALVADLQAQVNNLTKGNL